MGAHQNRDRSPRGHQCPRQPLEAETEIPGEASGTAAVRLHAGEFSLSSLSPRSPGALRLPAQVIDKDTAAQRSQVTADPGFESRSVWEQRSLLSAMVQVTKL